MLIRFAIDDDLPGIRSMLGQVLALHAEGRPDIFRAGTRKYSDEEILRYTPFDTMSREEAAAHLDRIIADWERAFTQIPEEVTDYGGPGCMDPQ